MNVMYIFEQGDGVLVSVFLLLIGMSLTSWYLIFWKAWNLRSERRIIAAFQSSHAVIFDWPCQLQTLPVLSGGLAVLLKEAAALQPQLIDHDIQQNQKLLSLYLGQALDKVRAWLDQGLTVLASIGSSAPFIGLFGTVWGIYGALTHIAAEGNASLHGVAGPMGEALIATAAGLFAAIPAVLAYNAFLRMNRLVLQDLRHIAEQMTLHLSDHVREKARGDVVKLARGGR